MHPIDWFQSSLPKVVTIGEELTAFIITRDDHSRHPKHSHPITDWRRLQSRASSANAQATVHDGPDHIRLLIRWQENIFSMPIITFPSVAQLWDPRQSTHSSTFKFI